MLAAYPLVVCDTAKVRFFKQITTSRPTSEQPCKLFAILQKYDFSSKSQQVRPILNVYNVVCDTAKVRFFKQITTNLGVFLVNEELFAILQKYDFSSKSQPIRQHLWYHRRLFAILQKYDFSSKSQPRV